MPVHTLAVPKSTAIVDPDRLREAMVTFTMPTCLMIRGCAGPARPDIGGRDAVWLGEPVPVRRTPPVIGLILNGFREYHELR
jgi:hypothetical protein